MCGFLLLGCSAADSPTQRMTAATTAQPTAGSGAAGASGSGEQAGAGGSAGSAGAAGTGVAGAAGTGAAGTGPRPDCDPGTYVGTYDCMLEMNGMPAFPLTGAVGFDLEIDESAENNCLPGDEFCFDLVIAEGSGTLFGFALLAGFETQLEGGLDCTTGEFRATAKDGVWGTPVAVDPSDPMSRLTVAKPPTGMFSGEMDGMHKGGDPQRIEGTWVLAETIFNMVCPGPFKVERQAPAAP